MQAQWTLQTYLKLPWRPYIDVIGATEYTLNAEANQVSPTSSRCWTHHSDLMLYNQVCIYLCV